MKQEKKIELEARLRQMLKEGLKDEDQACRPESQRPVCKVIRRRKGEKDKLIYSLD